MIETVVALTLFFLAAASYFDLRDGEIPDKLSFTLALLMVAFSLLSVVFGYGIALLRSAPVGVAYFAFGYLLYRLGQWGGGDVKIMGGVGLSLGLLDYLGFHWSNVELAPYYLSFFVNMGIASIPYIIAYSVILSFRKPSVLSKFRQTMGSWRFILGFSLLAVPPVAAYLSGRTLVSYVMALPPLYLLLSIYLKSVEYEALQKTVSVSDLSEGDVLAEDLVVDGVRIESKRSIEGMYCQKAEEIKKLALDGKIPPEIRVKWGVKFVPIIALAYALTLYRGNLMELALYRFFA